jgi:hypothetical protein
MELKTNNTKLAIVIPSCDNYSDLWEILVSQMKSNFIGIDYNIYIVCNSNHKKKISDINYLNIGIDQGWSSNFKEALKLIDEQYIFLWIDDLILLKKVDANLFTNILNLFIKDEGNYLRFSIVPSSNKKFNNYYGEASINALYRASTVMTIWKKDVLNDILVLGENAWEFEINGSIRSKKYDKFFICYDPIFIFYNAVIKGKWNKKIKNSLINKYGYKINDVRKVMTFKEQIYYDIKLYISIYYYKIYNKILIHFI